MQCRTERRAAMLVAQGPARWLALVAITGPSRPHANSIILQGHETRACIEAEKITRLTSHKRCM